MHGPCSIVHRGKKSALGSDTPQLEVVVLACTGTRQDQRAFSFETDTRARQGCDCCSGMCLRICNRRTIGETTRVQRPHPNLLIITIDESRGPTSRSSRVALQERTAADLLRLLAGDHSPLAAVVALGRVPDTDLVVRSCDQIASTGPIQSRDVFAVIRINGSRLCGLVVNLHTVKSSACGYRHNVRVLRMESHWVGSEHWFRRLFWNK